MSVSILVLAAGRGTRLGGEVPKVFLPIGGETVLERSVRRLAQVTEPGTFEIVLAVHPEDIRPHVDALLPRLRRHAPRLKVVTGGATRQESMHRALSASDPDFDLALVHDAARPFFPIPAAREALDRAREVGGAVVAVPVPDTLKRVNLARRVITTVDRDRVWMAQTPQAARRELLLKAVSAALEDGTAVTDDVALLERLQVPVVVVPGTASNIKITTPGDLALAEAIAALEDRQP